MVLEALVFDVLMQQKVTFLVHLSYFYVSFNFLLDWEKKHGKGSERFVEEGLATFQEGPRVVLGWQLREMVRKVSGSLKSLALNTLTEMSAGSFLFLLGVF